MENEKEKLEKLREIIGEILYGINSDFKYRGHGNNLGMWSTSDEDELKWTVLEKPDGPDEIDLAMFRVTVYLPNRFGIQIKVEMFPCSIYEWDFNDAKNIRNRVLVTVLRESLLKQLGNGAFEPKKLKREKVKEVLLSFRRSLRQTCSDLDSECIKSSMTTFDYV